MTLWQSSAELGPDQGLLQFTGSLELDSRLFKYDIEGSVAWAEALEKAGIYNSDELQTVTQTLREIELDIERGQLQLDPQLEDIHMNIEAQLTSRLPDLGPRLHTGRSRNDQVLVDVKLYLRDQLAELKQELRQLLQAFVDRAAGEQRTVLPGFTHLQPAQPVTLAHYLMAFFEKFRRDYQRLDRGNQGLKTLPLGSGALAGSGYSIDREFLARRLGFAEPSRNSLDTVSERDFIFDLLHGLTVLALHASRLSEDWIIWSSPTFGFCRLEDSFTTGSSIMPQKKNPDILELIRGQAGRLLAAYQGLGSLLKAQPLAYNRDLQEDKFYLFIALDTVRSWLPLLARLVSSVRFNRDTMAAAAGKNFLAATDLADYLTERGVEFRRAHNIVRQLVELARKTDRKLEQLTTEELTAASSLLGDEVRQLLQPQASLERREIIGGTGPRVVQQAVERATDWLNEVES